MALLINAGVPEWMTDEQFRDVLTPFLPDVTTYCGAPKESLPDVIMTMVVDFVEGLSLLPNLSLVQKLGAGVEQIINDPALPEHVQVARLRSKLQAQQMGEYCLTFVMSRQRNLEQHRVDSQQGNWNPVGPRRTADTTVGVLGLGNAGGRTADLFTTTGFRVIGWSRTPKSLPGVDSRCGNHALPDLLSECDYVCSLLPSTPLTRDLFDSKLLSKMKPEAVLINVGRGDLIVDDDLISALNEGSIGGAVLDVFRELPLPSNHPFWSHPKVTVTPHVSGWGDGDDSAIQDIAENYRRLVDHRPLLNVIDRETGY